MTLSVVVIGAGRRGRAHAEAVASLPDLARVVGVADVDAVRARALVAGSAPDAVASVDPTALLQAARPDVVYVTTPPPLHRAQAEAALALGANVVLEKPIALSVADAEAIGEAAARAGRLVHVCHQLRYLPGVAELRALLTGQAVALTRIWNERTAPDIPGNWSRAWGGGHVVEWGIHLLDLCRYLMETEAVEVSARYADQVLRGRPGWDNWDAYGLTIRWANGAIGAYASTYALKPGIPFESGLAIVAADGRASVDWSACAWTAPEGTTSWPAAPGEGDRALARAFLGAVASGDVSALRQDFDDALRTHRLVMAANASAIRGEPVAL